jgi:hypothetical protein
MNSQSLLKIALESTTTQKDLITKNLTSLLSQLRVASHSEPKIPRLVVVSKGRSLDEIGAAYDAGQRHFGEYHVHELQTKAGLLPQDIKWHMLGLFHAKKAKLLVNTVPNLWAVESVDTWVKAWKLEVAWKAKERSLGPGSLRSRSSLDRGYEERQNPGLANETSSLANETPSLANETPRNETLTLERQLPVANASGSETRNSALKVFVQVHTGEENCTLPFPPFSLPTTWFIL